MINTYVCVYAMYTSNNWIPSNPPPTAGTECSEVGNDFSSVSPFGIVIPGRPVASNITQIDPVRWTFMAGEPAKDFVVFLTDAGAASLPFSYGIGVYVSITSTPSAFQPEHNGGGNGTPPSVESGIGESTNEAASGLFHYIGCLRAERPSGLFSLPASLLPGGVPSSLSIEGVEPPLGSQMSPWSGQASMGGEGHPTSFNVRGNEWSDAALLSRNKMGVAPCEMLFSSNSVNHEHTNRGTNHSRRYIMAIGLSVESVDLLNSLSGAPLQSQMETTATKVAIGEKILEDFYGFVSSYAKLLKPQYFFSPPISCLSSSSTALERNAGNLVRNQVMNGMGSSFPCSGAWIKERESLLISLFGVSGVRRAAEDVMLTGAAPSCERPGDLSVCHGTAHSSGGEYLVMPMSFVNKWRERLQRILQKDKSFISN